jgi:ribosomal protein S18
MFDRLKEAAAYEDDQELLNAVHKYKEADDLADELARSQGSNTLYHLLYREKAYQCKNRINKILKALNNTPEAKYSDTNLQALRTYIVDAAKKLQKTQTGLSDKHKVFLQNAIKLNET